MTLKDYKLTSEFSYLEQVIDEIRHSVSAIQLLPSEVQTATRLVYYVGIRKSFIASTGIGAVGFAVALFVQSKGLQRSSEVQMLRLKVLGCYLQEKCSKTDQEKILEMLLTTDRMLQVGSRLFQKGQSLERYLFADLFQKASFSFFLSYTHPVGGMMGGSNNEKWIAQECQASSGLSFLLIAFIYIYAPFSHFHYLVSLHVGRVGRYFFMKPVTFGPSGPMIHLRICTSRIKYASDQSL